MQFTAPLLRGRLIKRYKRFLADIQLDNGEELTAHCANPGAMLGLKDEGSIVWVSPANNPKRKLKYDWQLIEADNTLIGINTALPNKLAEEAISNGTITELQGYTNLSREVKYGVNSRIDIFLQETNKPDTYVEVKNVHLRREGKRIEFPDCVTTRGAKHLVELANMVEQGNRAVMLYIIQRPDGDSFSLASDLDPAYATAFKDALEKGVEAYAYSCAISTTGIKVEKSIPIVHT